ncbi:MAG TPA: S6e family ribosomal protein [Candidatus Paceibacterota bacterium]|nr:S6e family ribosomal protein [Candidatus Paceibacterota bacterium]
MVFKINLSEKNGKTFHLETESEELIGKKIGEKIQGKEINSDLSGYEFEIKGTSDKAGFPGKKDVHGPTLKKILLTKGPFLHKIPHKGFRRKKIVRGNEISSHIVQINLLVTKKGSKSLEEIFPDQCQPKESKKKAE